MNKRKSAPLSNPFSRHSRLDRESSYDESRFLTGSQIKFGMTVGLARVSSYTLAVIFVLLPFHAFFTTWLGASFGHIDLFRIWKELLLVPLTVLALVILSRDKGLLAKLKSSWIIRLILGYALLHIVIGLIAFGQHGVTGQALIYSLIINLRLPLIFVICLVIGSKSRWMVDNWQQLILGPAIIVVLFGLLQHFVLGVNFLSHFGYGVGTIPAYQTVDQKIDYVRIQSTLRGSNPLGAYLVLIGVILLAGLVRSKKRGRWKWLVASLAQRGHYFLLTPEVLG